MSLGLSCGPENDTEYGRFTMGGKAYMVRLSCQRVAVFSWEAPRFGYCRVTIETEVMLEAEAAEVSPPLRVGRVLDSSPITIELRRSSDALGQYVHATVEAVDPGPLVTVRRPGTLCRSGRDGECMWGDCPQRRDGEPHATGRHCPLDKFDEDWG